MSLAATTAVLLLIPPAVMAFPFAVRSALVKLNDLRRRLLWWHGLWALLALSALVFRVRDDVSIRQSPVDPSAAYRIGLIGIAATILVARVLLRRTELTAAMSRGLVALLTAYALLSLCSTLWSIYPEWTAYKSVEYLVDLAALAAILEHVRSFRSYKTLFDWTWLGVAALLLSVWLGVVLWPDQALVSAGGPLSFRIAGAYPALDQNTVGEGAAILAIVALSRLLRPCVSGRAFYLLVLLGGLCTLIMSQTRAAIVGFLFSAIAVMLLHRRIRLLGAVIVLVLLAVFLTNGVAWIESAWQRGDSGYTIETLSERTSRWQVGWQYFLERPLLGHGGYAATRFGLPSTTAWDANAIGVLSTYLEVMLGTGLLGLSIVVAAIVLTWRMLIYWLRNHKVWSVQREVAIETLGVLFIITVRSFVTTQFILHSSLVFLAILGFAELLRRQKDAFGSSRLCNLNYADPPGLSSEAVAATLTSASATD
jgi:O-antigen ligase